MFARVFAIASLVALVVASPAPLAVRDQCNSGSINCCNMQQASEVSSVLNSLGLLDSLGLGAVLASATGQVGLGCSPLTLIGTGGGGQCTQQTACCDNNTFNGLVNVACVPINLNV